MWHDTDAARRVSPTRILSYMQETSNAQLETLGPSLEKLRDEEGRGFILTRSRTRFYAEIHAYEEIRVQTWITDSRGFTFNRCFRVLRGEEVVAEAYTSWALLDLASRRFVPNSDFTFHFDGEPPLPLGEGLRIAFPKENPLLPVGEREIRYSDLDYNMHMNNTKYGDMILDFVPDIENKHLSEMTLSFVKEAHYGAHLTVNRVEKDGVYYFRTQNEAGETCLEAEVRF